MTEQQFFEISWPERFTVYYTNGSSEVLSACDGVGFTPPEDDPDSRGFIDAAIPSKSRSRKRATYGGRTVFFVQILRLEGNCGEILWESKE